MRYETPTALKHDARTLTEDARALLAATAEMTDLKVTEARKRLSAALEKGRLTCDRVQERALEGAKVADETVRTHPYESMSIAFGVGMLIGLLLRSRD